MEPRRPAMHGWLWRELGCWREALELDLAASALLRRLADPQRLSRVLASAAHAHCLLGELAEARRALDEAQALVAAEHRRCAGRMHPLWAARAELELRAGDWDQLELLSQEWLERSQAQSHAEGELAARRALARCWLARGELDRARQHVNAAVERAAARPVPLFDWRSQLLLAEVASRTGELEAAAAARESARRQMERIAEQLAPEQSERWWRQARTPLMAR